MKEGGREAEEGEEPGEGRGLERAGATPTNQPFYLWRAKNSACMTENEGGRDLEGDGMHVYACMYVCILYERHCMYFVWALREDDIQEMEEWSKRGDRVKRRGVDYKILNATKSFHYLQIRR